MIGCNQDTCEDTQNSLKPPNTNKPPNPSDIRNLQRYVEITRAMNKTAMSHNGVFHGTAIDVLDVLVHNTH